MCGVREMEKMAGSDIPFRQEVLGHSEAGTWRLGAVRQLPVCTIVSSFIHQVLFPTKLHGKLG
jgi:hypothetical protein